MLVAVVLAVLGAGTYFAVHAIAGRPANAVTTHRPSVTPTISATPSRTPQPGPPPVGRLGMYQIAEKPYTLTEPATGVHGPRVLQVTLRYPVLPATPAYSRPAGGTFPLVVFAPGFKQCSAVYRHLLRQWASAGYVVAAVDFPLTNCRVPKAPESDLSNQPADMAYVIRQVLALSGQPQGPLAGLISDTKIAVAGHSDGANAVAAMAGTSCCKDHKIRAAIVLAGNQWPWGADTWFAGHTPPMLFVQGTADTWNKPQLSLQLYRADRTGTRYYLDLPGANHFSPYQGHFAPEPIVARVTLAFLDRYVDGQQGELAQMQQAGHVPGVAKLVTAGRMP